MPRRQSIARKTKYELVPPNRTAARAKEMGLVHEVVAGDRLDLSVDRYVQQFLKAAPSAVAATKALLGSL